MSEPGASTRAAGFSPQWGPIVAGALAAAALALVLHAFAAAVGLSISSTAPTWRDTSFALVLLSGLYLVLSALAAYGLGGYVTGRLTSARYAPDSDEAELRDGAHGLIAWALATILTALIALSATQALSRVTAPGSGNAGPAASVGSESLIAPEIDRLFRSERPPQGDVAATRAEAGRLLLSASSHSGLQPDDRAWLIRLTAARTGLNEADATRRVDQVVARSSETITKARRAGLVIGFMTGAAALLGAVAAWFAAVAGGQHRDGGAVPAWMGHRRPVTTTSRTVLP
ncbi:hypothetical protein CH341_10990 [Rhodoplanes roseus]|uniref:Uncharacterized protein n=1 Tax=Rhodoplanes roseus TaxID=29409 RepID=A0A327L0W4_9BRAD|nr:hypothetical protein CH341_10990 [Rhodoplanes roseus]